MKIIRVLAGVIVGMITITLVTESIEFVLVKLVSGMSFSELAENEEYYFEVRNTGWILIFKMCYTTLAGFIGGYFGAKIGAQLSGVTILLLIALQVISLVWAGFISEMSSTGPVWMWVGLIMLVPVGIYFGFRRGGGR